MRTTVAPTATPPEADDARQPRERPVRCCAHQRPTWRYDARCDICIEEAAS